MHNAHRRLHHTGLLLRRLLPAVGGLAGTCKLLFQHELVHDTLPVFFHLFACGEQLLLLLLVKRHALSLHHKIAALYDACNLGSAVKTCRELAIAAIDYIAPIL